MVLLWITLNFFSKIVQIHGKRLLIPHVLARVGMQEEVWAADEKLFSKYSHSKDCLSKLL